VAFGRQSDLDRALDEAIGGAEAPPFAEFALTLYAFLSRLDRELQAKGSSHVLFCAREGQFLTRLFERLCGAESDIVAQYFLVSRRATLLPSLRPIHEEDLAQVLRSISDLTNAGFLHSVALTELTSESTIDRDGPFDLQAIRNDNVVCEAYEARRVEQKQLLTRYVEGLTGPDTSELHVVDVGWKGSIQDHLSMALADRWQVHGYYLGLVAERPILNLESKTALVFGPDSDTHAHYRVLKHFKAIWEFVLAADHGSVQSYELDSNGIVGAVLDPHRVELADFERVVEHVQAGLYEVFDRLCELNELASLNDADLQELVARRHSRMLFFPTRAELEIAQSRGHYANFGNPWVKEVPVGERLSVVQRVRNMAGLVRTPRALLRGFPPLKLHRLGLDPLIPIVGFYRRLREFPPAMLRLKRREQTSR